MLGEKANLLEDSCGDVGFDIGIWELGEILNKHPQAYTFCPKLCIFWLVINCQFFP